MFDLEDFLILDLIEGAEEREEAESALSDLSYAITELDFAAADIESAASERDEARQRYEDACDEYDSKRDDFELALNDARDCISALEMYGDTSSFDLEIAEYEHKLDEYDE